VSVPDDIAVKDVAVRDVAVKDVSVDIVPEIIGLATWEEE
jgi:hypothetical protein